MFREGDKNVACILAACSLSWLRRGTSGAAAIEFALVLPLLLTVMFGVVSFGSIAFTNSRMENAARDAARVLAVKSGTPATALSTAQSELSNSTSYSYLICAPTVNCTCTNLSNGVTCDWPTTTPAINTAADVAVTIGFPMSKAALVDWLGFFQNGTLLARVIMYKEKQ